MALSHVMNLVSNSGLVGAAGGSGSGGGGGNLDSQTVTVGEHSTSGGGSGVPNNTSVYKGFFTMSSTTYGSIADGTSNLYSGAAITELRYQWNTVFSTANLRLHVTGANRANSGWTTLTIGSTAYLRTNATYTADQSGETTWLWWIGYDGGSPGGAQNPFSAATTTTTCVFT